MNSKKKARKERLIERLNYKLAALNRQAKGHDHQGDDRRNLLAAVVRVETRLEEARVGL